MFRLGHTSVCCPELNACCTYMYTCVHVVLSFIQICTTVYLYHFFRSEFFAEGGGSERSPLYHILRDA
jgi:hypothetical protein